jgi:CHAT domain
MSRDDHPCLNLAVDKLRSADQENYAIWVIKAPYPGGYVHHDCNWDDELTRSWMAWQEMFSSAANQIQYPKFPAVASGQMVKPAPIGGMSQASNYSTRLMQHLGISMWQWLFNGSIDMAMAHSQGIAIGQKRPLRLRLEVRDPDLISFPWEIIQPQPGKPAVSLNQEIFFSRTTSDVDQLPPQRNDRAIRILLVLGSNNVYQHNLSLAEEAAAIAQVLRNAYPSGFAPTDRMPPAACQVDTLVQPSLNSLISTLDDGSYNLFFYAGHGIPGADGGILSLSDEAKLNGTELAQVLVRNQVKLAVFNSCWGAQPYHARYDR